MPDRLITPGTLHIVGVLPVKPTRCNRFLLFPPWRRSCEVPSDCMVVISVKEPQQCLFFCAYTLWALVLSGHKLLTVTNTVDVSSNTHIHTRGHHSQSHRWLNSDAHVVNKCAHQNKTKWFLWLDLGENLFTLSSWLIANASCWAAMLCHGWGFRLRTRQWLTVVRYVLLCSTGCNESVWLPGLKCRQQAEEKWSVF